jgi:hypothetical protein
MVKCICVGNGGGRKVKSNSWRRVMRFAELKMGGAGLQLCF